MGVLNIRLQSDSEMIHITQSTPVSQKIIECN